MKKILKSVACLTLVLLVSCSSKDIPIDDFESGTFDGWMVEGDVFGSTPTKGSYSDQQEVKGFEGNYLANSFNGGDISIGKLTSKEFVIERDYINFLLGGGAGPNTYIELVVDGKSVLKAHAMTNGDTLSRMTWDVKAYRGKSAVIRIVDNDSSGWGHILADQIEMSNTEKSSVLLNHSISFDVSQKYILIPIQDESPAIPVSLDVDGQVIGVPMNIRIAQTKVDYWIPIPVEQYKGQKVTLTLSNVNKEDIGYTQINQSDRFDFDYNEKYRPSYHYTPQYGWMNDPNGMVYYDGEYHLFYQYNPYGSLWGNMTWGHAVSKDLLTWEYLSAGIVPDSLGAIFSGSAVIDKDNTAGFGKDAMIAIYTSAGKTQTQSIAYSTDRGRTFTKYNNNPVLTDPDIVDFRDPKVMWHEASQKWVMTLATSQTITFYGSKDLKAWEKLSEFGEGIGAHGGVWECPDLFPLTYNGQTKWVLFVSINPGGPNGGSATQYFVGNFDGKTFKADEMPYPLWLDYGRDNYAGVTWSNVPASDGRRLFIGWMNNWAYAERPLPITHFRSAMTLPRELKLVHNGKHLVVANPPIEGIVDLRSDKKSLGDIKIDTSYSIDKLLDNNSGAYEIEMSVKANSAKRFTFKLSNRMQEKMVFSFDIENESLSIDRSKSGNVNFCDNFALPKIEAPLVKKDTYKIRLFIDKASSELFVNDGSLVSTNIMFPTEPYNTLTFESESEINVENIFIYKIN
ncbi:GH32 C-terminal domain-containing protein [Dysgonomonas sp. ZJ709]|uniref:GH32 C-terminal domain-containing protein n=1 Tax=Dysgonomonas sp. ZJ709 TaxID=2709797 RepID=UPI0013EA397C|nr:GH32 C-terminal domain-containing protein [Dysgonomonas sp. ZJ709]